MFGRGLTIAAATLACWTMAGGAAFAQDTTKEGGWYARVFGGVSTLSDTDVRVNNTRASGTFSGGLLVGGAVGYDYAGPWRAEIEYAYRSSSVDRLPASFARDGDYASTAIMLNGLYSFGEIGRLRPYVGAGVGFTREVDFDLTSGPAAPPPSAVGEYSDSGLFAYQAIAGADVAFGERWSGFGELRAFGVNSPSLPGTSGRTLTADYRTFDVLVGLSVAF
jgi:opacity protein-like surface antigen